MKMKNILKKSLIMFAVLCLCLPVLVPATVKAETGAEEMIGASKLAAPEITSVKNYKTGIKITWTAVPGADTYRVYRKQLKTYKNDHEETEWAAIGDTDGYEFFNSFGNDPCVGTRFSYKVCAVSPKAGKESEPVTAVRMARPRGVSFANVKDGIKIKVYLPRGVTGFIVYRKAEGDSSYTRVAKVKRLSTLDGYNIYTDADTADGAWYSYKVCYYKYGYGYGAVSKEYKYPRLGTAPALTLKKSDSSVKLTWSEVSGASGYRVERKCIGWGDSFLKCADVTGTTYNDTKLTHNTSEGIQSYTEISYRVRPYFIVGSKTYYGVYSKVKTIDLTK